MAKQKTKPLSEIDLNNLGVSGEQEKPKRKPNNRGCGCLMLIALLAGIFALSSASKKPDPTFAALAATATPLGGGVAAVATFTVTPYPDITMTATEPAPFEEEEASLKELPGVISVELIERSGTDYFAIVTTHPKFNKESFAQLLLGKAIKVDLYTFRFAVRIDDGESEPLWWVYTDNIWTSAKTPPAWVDTTTIEARFAPPTPEAIIVTTIGPTQSLATQDPVRAMTAKTYYADGAINVRACADTSCDLVVSLAQGDAVTANGTIDGKAVNAGNTIWYRVTVNGKTGYVYSDLVSTVRPATVSSGGGSNTGGSTANGGQSVTPMQEPPKVWDCSGDVYNCDSFASRAERRSYFEQCPNDPSRLDADGDGRYCESN